MYLHPVSLTSDGLFEMFLANILPVGSNASEAEEVVMKSVSYIHEIEGKLVNVHDKHCHYTVVIASIFLIHKLPWKEKSLVRMEKCKI